MDRPLRIILPVAGLAAYLVVVTGLAFHFQFPYGQAAQAARARLEATTPLRLSFNALERGRPFTVRLDQAVLSLASSGGPVQLLDLDQVRLNLNPLRLLTGRLGADFKTRSEAGALEGRLDYQSGGKQDFRLRLKAMDLPGFAVNLPQTGGISGRLTGRITVLGQGRTGPIGGEGSIRIGPGRLTGLKIPGLPLTDLDFDHLTLEFKLERNRMILDRLTIEGPAGKLDLGGRIMGFKRPRLSLTGSARMESGGRLLAGADFRVTGPMSRPQVQVISMKGPGLKSKP